MVLIWCTDHEDDHDSFPFYLIDKDGDVEVVNVWPVDGPHESDDDTAHLCNLLTKVTMSMVLIWCTDHEDDHASFPFYLIDKDGDVEVVDVWPVDCPHESDDDTAPV